MKGGPQTWGEFEEDPISVESACLSLDGTCIAAVFANGTLCIYDTTTGGVILPPFEVDENPRSVIFSRDGKLVASGGKTLRLWNVQTGEEVQSFDINVYSLALSLDGTCIAAGCEGRYNDWSDYYRYREDGSYNLRVINLELAKISKFPAEFFSPSARGRIKPLMGEVRFSPFEGHQNQINCVAYSADGQHIASSSDDFTVRVWDVSTGLRRTFRTTYNWISSVTFSPDGTQIASDTTLFNLSTGSQFDLFGGKERAVFSLAFSVDGRYLASGSYLASDFFAACQIWDTSTHQTKKKKKNRKAHKTVKLIGHTGDVPSVVFFPDGKQIMSASQDGTIRVWDIELLEERREMDGWQMNYSEDGSWVLGPEREHLFWTPLPFGHARNTLVIGDCLKIDFSNFVHGDEWMKCREPL